MPACRRINLVYADNGAGLTKDARIIAATLRRSGHRVQLTPRAPRQFPRTWRFAPEIVADVVGNAYQQAIRAWARRSRGWDINIFLESLVPEYFECARINCLLQNQEWLSDRDRALLGDIDVVLFKTRHALQRLSSHARASHLIGFTSLDRSDPAVTRKPNTALHVGGWNPHKGTRLVAGTWVAHPEWPHLTVVSQLTLELPPARNMTWVGTRLFERSLQELQNASPIHLCPSEVEGFGHTLMEGLSCGAVVVTTDAPPMNELISEHEGFLVPPSETASMASGTRYIVDETALAAVLERVWATSPDRLHVMRQSSRSRFLQVRSAFEQRFDQLIGQL